MEAKTGYALSVEGELRLCVFSRGRGARPPYRCPTLLGAHAVPPRSAIAPPTSPTARGRCSTARRPARRVDVYCDEGAFTLEETRRDPRRGARRAACAVRAHAGQFADLGAAGLVASLGGLSADHLEHVSEDAGAGDGGGGVVATLLPGACVQLRLPPPPVARLRAAGCRLRAGDRFQPRLVDERDSAVADVAACTHLGLTVDEVWLGGHPPRGAAPPAAPRRDASRPALPAIWCCGR